MTPAEKKQIQEWDSFLKTFSQASYVDLNESDEDKKKRIAGYFAHPNGFFDFCYYYFPKVVKSPFGKWHKKASKYIITTDTCFFVGKISRDLAKSSLMAMLKVYLALKGEIKSGVLCSHIKDQAEDLLAPVKIAFEKNELLIRDFGDLRGAKWASNKFELTTGTKFRAIGAGQNPRGEKNEDSERPDYFEFDDFDDPEVCRNPERLDNHWEFVKGDCFGTFHVSGKRRVVFINNKIDEDCIIERAADHAKTIANSFVIQVNLTDENGKSNWQEAYTDKQCAEMIALLGDAAETEYFQNPVKKGKLFQKEWFVFKKMPPLHKYKMLLAYLDGGFKKTRTSDTKALILLGIYNGEIHIRKAYVDNVSIETMIAWHYDLDAIIKKAGATCMWYMEEVFLLSMLYDHFDAAAPKYGYRIPIMGDKRAKPDKDLRIANTAGYFERGKVFIDEQIKDDRGLKRLINQYLRFRVGLRNVEKDGPDAFEGGLFILNSMAAHNPANIFIPHGKTRNKRI